MKKYALFAIVLLLCSCYDTPSNKYFFIPDEEDSNLPAYTESGYNSFGVKYEDSYFLSSENSHFTISYQAGILNFRLQDYIDAEKMALTFSFPASPVQTYQDLISLNGITIDLTKDFCDVVMEIGYQPDTLNVLTGNLTFRRVQILRIDKEENRAILSGTFDLRFLRNNILETLSGGRFDLGISYVDFLSD